MSVILVTSTNVADLHLNLRALSAQTVRDELELILVAPRDETATEDVSGLVGFHSMSVMRLPDVTSRGSAAAAAVRTARGEIVALMENHAFPEADWAEQILRAHEGPWTAVGPRVDGMNLRSWTSRAYRLIFYGWLTGRDQPEETTHLPWHNTTYKRHHLRPFMSHLEAMLDHEGRFHRILSAQGHRFYFCPAARLRHANVSRLRPVLQLAFCTGRIFACERHHEWRWWRRVAFAAAWPLFPWIRLAQMRPDYRRIAREEPMWFLLPLVLLLLHLMALGESAGYLFGIGRAAEWTDRHELSGAKERMSRFDVVELEKLVSGR
jgi:hypothetical protein